MFSSMRSAALFLAVAAGYILLQGSPVSWHPILRVCLAVTALVIGIIIWGKRDKPTSTVAQPARPPRWLDYLTVGVALLVVECFFLFVLATVPDKAEILALDLDSHLHPEGYETEEESGPGEGAGKSSGDQLSSGNWLWRGKGEIHLQSKGRIRPSNRPEVYLWPKSDKDYKLFNNSQRFLRIFTLATYKKAVWSPLVTVPRTLTAEDGRIALNSKSGRTVEYEISHQENAKGRSLAVTIPTLNSIEIPFLRETAADTFRLPPIAADKTIYRYAATSTLGTFDTIPESASFEPAIDPRGEYLQLPKDDLLRERLDTLAATFTGSPRESLRQLRAHLLQNCTYSLEVDIPDGSDPLEDFLFESRKGYCTHFSSAGALLARALGFPSRVAFGWSGGRYYGGQNFYVFRGREAHAWTEIHLKNHGWVIFDTTPISRGEGSPSVANQDEESPTDFNEMTDESVTVGSLAPLKNAALGVGSIGLVTFIIAVIARRPKEKDAATRSAANHLPPSPNYLTLFKRACSAHGYPMPAGRTLRTHLDLIPAPAFATDLLDYHYAVQYADAPRDKKKEKSLSQQLRRWEQERP